MKDDIIRMAREAGFAVNEKARQHQPNCIFHTQHMVDELLERFAALARAAERERIIAQNAPEIEKINAHIKTLEKALEDEREAIAKMVAGLFDDPNDSVLAFIVDAIRARGNT